MKRTALNFVGIGLAFLMCSCGNGSGDQIRTDTVNVPTEISDTASDGVHENADTDEPSNIDTEEDTAMKAETDITITVGENVITATLDDSETSKQFIASLPRTFTMNEYGGREYYGAIENLSEDGNMVDDFENGDVTYFTGGPAFAIFYGRQGESHQSGLIRMGKITSDLSVFETLGAPVEMLVEVAGASEYDTELVWENLQDGLTDEERELVNLLLVRCDAMVNKDIDAMSELMADDIILTHMSGRTQTKEEYLAEIADGTLNYHHGKIIDPVVEIDGDTAYISCDTEWYATVYGSTGTWRMSGCSGLVKQNGKWLWATSERPQGR